MPLTPPSRLSPADAFARYETIRPRLPAPIRQGAALTAGSLGELAMAYDLFVLDSFGVLNVGDRAIPGAVARIASLRRSGKSVAVLTNAAANPAEALMEKYHRLGFDFAPDDVISSRQIALAHLSRNLPDGPIAVIGNAAAIESEAIRQRAVAPDEDAAAMLFLEAAVWNTQANDALAQRLAQRPCPLYIANPDLVAPRETGLSLEPGHFAHDLIDRCAVDTQFFGKPFGDAFAAVEARFPHIPPHRIVMIGDTLQTDILGGLARGWGTALVTDHGSLTGLDVASAIARSGIRPDWVIPAI